MSESELNFEDIWKVLDIVKIYDNLWQGAFPPPGDVIASKGFDVLVLAALEHQRPELYPGVEVVLAPGDDDERPNRLERFLPIWLPVARAVADRVRAGDKCLVTCMGGYNRSGFINAVALHHLTGWKGIDCVERVRSRREYALSNETFADWIIDNVGVISLP